MSTCHWSTIGCPFSVYVILMRIFIACCAAGQEEGEFRVRLREIRSAEGGLKFRQAIVQGYYETTGT